ncbi:MAG: SCP2 sterol-binding domain-containing protein [Promethearchaeota archaeon]
MDIEKLKEKYLPKLEAEELTWEEVPEVMELLVGIANTDEDFKDEFEDLTKSYAFIITDKPENEHMWIKIEEGKFSSGSGPLKPVDLAFSCDSKVAAGMVSGAVDSNTAFMKGELKLDGAISDGMKFQNILALFRDVLDL